MPTTLRCLVCLLAVLAGPVAADQDPDAAPDPGPAVEQAPVATDEDSADQEQKPAETPAFDNQPGRMRKLSTPEGIAFSAYEAGPRGAKWGILLVPEQWGLDAHVRAWVDHLATLGYRALAVDIYDGKTATSDKRAQALARGLDQAATDAKYRAALSVLKAPGRKLATMGFGFGGAQAMRATLADANDVAATVIYQTPPPTDDSMVKGIKGQLFSVYATQGTTVPTEQINAFAAAMRGAKKPITLKLVDMSADGIDKPGDRFDGGIVQAAWKDTEVFLKKAEAEPPCKGCGHKKRKYVRHRHYRRHR